MRESGRMQPAASVASQDQCMCDETVSGCYSDQGWGGRGWWFSGLGILTPIKWLATLVLSKSIEEFLSECEEGAARSFEWVAAGMGRGEMYRFEMKKPSGKGYAVEQRYSSVGGGDARHR